MQSHCNPAPEFVGDQPAPSLDALRRLVQLQMGWDSANRERCERAAQIILFRRIYAEPDGSNMVESETHPGRYYRVTIMGCECPDQQIRQTRACKHILAVRFSRQLGIKPLVDHEVTRKDMADEYVRLFGREA